MEYCRDRYGAFPVSIFNVYSCSMCYSYLFQYGAPLQPDRTQPWKLVSTSNSDIYPASFSVIADVTNGTASDVICEGLNDLDCNRWRNCCQAAIDCCQRQLSIPMLNDTEGLYCSRTWDGYGCFDDALASTRAFISCPSYVEHASPSAMAYKDCTENGTWWLDPTTGSEWTNYATCVQTNPIFQNFHTVVHVALACNIISLMLLIPACLIFLGIRQLRSQKRIKLHLCLFLSFIITSIVTILWDQIVYVDRLENPRNATVMYQNSGGCKFLYVLSRYVCTCNFFWMFCEGFYLHRLIVHAFSVPKTLIPYYVFGWVGSWIPVVIYSIIRAASPQFDYELCIPVELVSNSFDTYETRSYSASQKDQSCLPKLHHSSCWVHNIVGYEWILYAPNLICLAMNLVFLFNILRILCSKLQAHPNEPSNYRKALRATFVLIPLFGLQQFVVIYRPEPESPLMFTYEIIHNVIINTQGAMVALIFCFFNGEVFTHIKNSVNRFIKSDSRPEYMRKGSTTSATQFTSMSVAPRRGTKCVENSDRGYIPLSTSTTNDTLDTPTTPSNGHVTFAV